MGHRADAFTDRMTALSRVLGPLALGIAILIGGLPTAVAAATSDSAEADLVQLVNAFRAERGLSRLVVSDTLTSSAKWMATDMSVYDYFSHISRDGRGPAQRMADAGYPVTQTWVGEDIAAGYTTASEVMSGWLKSSIHLAVLTNADYRAIGVGRAWGSGSTYGTYWTMDVGGVVDATTSAPALDATTSAPAFDPGYHGAWAGQSADVTLPPGGTATLVLALRNIGSRGWYQGSPGQQANLGTADPLDVPRDDLAYGWLSPNRLATTTTTYVGPGQLGWFQFQVRAPASPGTYRLRVRGVIDGTTWLEDPGIYWDITVR